VWAPLLRWARGWRHCSRTDHQPRMNPPVHLYQYCSRHRPTIGTLLLTEALL
jgi:hypothetical protein